MKTLIMFYKMSPGEERVADTLWPFHLFCSAIAIPYFLLLGSSTNFLLKT
jgi:hypothetical protein